MVKEFSMPSFYRRACYIVFFIIFIILIILISFFFSKPGATSNEIWIPVRPTYIEDRIGVIGKIGASERRTIVAPFEGRVDNVEISIGDMVSNDQLLATLDITQLDVKIREANSEVLKSESLLQELMHWESSADVSRARRSLSSLEITLQNVQNELQETRRLFSRGIIPRNEVDTLEQKLLLLRMDMAERRDELNSTLERGQGNSLRIAEMQAANARINYDSLVGLRSLREIRAPFDGIILQPNSERDASSNISLQAGLIVSHGTPLYDIASVEEMVATAAIGERDLGEIRIGMPVNITGDGFQDFVLEGRIINIGEQAIENRDHLGGSTYQISVGIIFKDRSVRKSIRLGMSARLSIVTYSNENGLVVPVEAIQRNEQAEPYVIYRETMTSPPQPITVKIEHTVPQGVEISGIQSGYIQVPISPNDFRKVSEL